MKSMIRNVDDHGVHYEALMFVCPGCYTFSEHDTGLHMLPVNSKEKSPSWDWDGNLEAPTLSPSILSNKDNPQLRCHSFLKAGVFEFLEDCAHSLAGLHVPMMDLPDWIIHEES